MGYGAWGRAWCRGNPTKALPPGYLPARPDWPIMTTRPGRFAPISGRASPRDSPSAWYRIAVELPQSLDGTEVAGSRVWFETNVDNYGEVWIDGGIDRATGVIVGINASQRVEVSGSAVPGARHVIACLVANGPLAEPRGGIFMRFATLAFESPG